MDNKPPSLSDSSNHMVYGVIFAIIGIVALVALLFVVFSRSEADDASQTAAVTNVAPTVDTVITRITAGGADQATVTPTEGTTKTIYIGGVVSDSNGCQDASGPTVYTNWAMKIYRTNHASGAVCSADNNDCYAGDSADNTVSGCTTAVNDTTTDYEWIDTLQYWVDPTDTGATQVATDWTAAITAQDEATLTGSNTDTFEMGSVIALDVTSAIDYGTIALGGDSAEKSITFTATGNRAIDADQTASGDMSCTGLGSDALSVGAAHMSLTTGFTYGTGDQALATSTTNFDLTLAQRTDEALPSTDTAYLVLRLPSTGIGGTCTNTITFAAKADAA